VELFGNAAGGVNDHRLLPWLVLFLSDMNILRSLSRPINYASPENDPQARDPYQRHPECLNDDSRHFAFLAIRLICSKAGLASRVKRPTRTVKYGDGLNSPGLSFTGLGEGAKRSQPSCRRQIH